MINPTKLGVICPAVLQLEPLRTYPTLQAMHTSETVQSLQLLVLQVAQVYPFQYVPFPHTQLVPENPGVQ